MGSIKCLLILNTLLNFAVLVEFEYTDTYSEAYEYGLCQDCTSN